MVISVAIQKGGSGKTTTVMNLAAALRDIGKKVLLLDLDPQNNLTQALGIESASDENIYQLLKTAAGGTRPDITAAIVHKNGMDLIPGTLDLAHAELELVSVYGREQLLQEMLASVRDKYNYILIDCPPAIGMLTVNALVASDYIIMPMQAEFLPLRGLQSFMRFYNRVKKLNPALAILGILITRYDTRVGMSQKVIDEILEEKTLGPRLFDTKIRINNALAKAQEHGQDIFTFDPASNGAMNYMALAFEVQSRLETASV
ncbi:MAG: ParA family protein [Bacteroidota bacterium]